MNIAFFADINDNHNQKWIAHLSKRHSITVFTEKKNNLINQNSINTNFIKIHYLLPNEYPLKNIFERNKTLTAINNILAENKTDVVHSIYAIPYSLWAGEVKNKNHIITTYGSDMLVDYAIKWKNPKSIKEVITFFLLRKKMRDAFNSAKYITSTSKEQQKIITSFIKDKGKLSITRTGVDCSSFLKIYATATRQSQGITILSNRAMRPLYNIDIIIDAFALLKNKHNLKNVKLTLLNYYTDELYFKDIEKKIADNNLIEDITILSDLNFEELIQQYKNADVVVMIPKSDGTPVTGVETLLSKKPLIVGNLNYDTDLFNEDTVWKLEKTDSLHLCDKFFEVLHASENIKTEKSENGYSAAIHNADLDTEILKIEKLYRKMCDRMSEHYQICSNCILDSNGDPDIVFDEKGVCNYCINYAKAHTTTDTSKSNEQKLQAIVAEIKEYGKNNDYDCLIGVSGGVDSTYLALQAKKLGLRPLIVHLDNGWNSELAVMNIENIIKKLNFDLYTYVINWTEFKDIQLSFLKASVVDIELITDQAIGAILFRLAKKYNIKYILSGSNDSTEAILPGKWHHWKTDVLNIRAIHKMFGKQKMKTYPTLGFFKHLYYTRTLNLKSIPLLNYMPYVKDEAKKAITDELGWRDYGGKHYESIFTRFYQSYILPVKFKIDKRKAHLSTLICSGQLTREEALKELKQPIYDPDKLADDYEYVIKKLNLNKGQFEELMALPIKQHTDYPSYLTRHYKYQLALSKILKPITKLLKK